MSEVFDFQMIGAENIGTIITWLLQFLLTSGWGLIAYVLTAITTYTIAKRRGINHAWMAWVPVLDCWLLGCISDQYQYVVKQKTKSRRKVMLTLKIVSMVLTVALVVCGVTVASNLLMGILSNGNPEDVIFSMMGSILGALGILIPKLGVAIALLVFHYIALYDVYCSCCPQNKVLFLLLSIFVRVTEPFFLFFNRKRDDGMPPRRPEPAQYIPPQPVENHDTSFDTQM